MRRTLIIVGTLLIAILLVLGACAPAPAPPTEPAPALPTEPTPAPEETPTPSEITPPIEPERQEISFSDPSGDLFDKAGESVTAEPYLDIIEAELSLSNGYYLAKIKLNGPLPTKTDDTSTFIEWDILVDSDCNLGTGWNLPLICNDIGPDYRVYVGLKDSEYKASVQDIKSNTYKSIEYEIDGNIVELRFPSETVGEPANFNFVGAVRKYAKAGDPGTLVVADKAPNEGHYVFPNHYFP